MSFPQKNTAGTGKAKASKRQQLVRQALLKHAEARQTDDGADVSGGGSGSGGSDMVGRTGNARAATKEKEGSLSPGVHSPSDVGGDTVEVLAPGGGRKRSARPRDEDCGGNGRGVASADNGKTSASKSSTAAAASKSRENSGRSEAGGGASIAWAGQGQGGRRPATGTALLLSDPLSHSPAYVACGRDDSAGAEGGGEDEQEAGSISKERICTGDSGGVDGRAKGKRRAAPNVKDGDECQLRYVLFILSVAWRSVVGFGALVLDGLHAW